LNKSSSNNSTRILAGPAFSSASPRFLDLLGLLGRPLLFVIYWLSGFMPRNPQLWLFGSWSGRRYADNAAALFEHVSREANDVRAVWVTRDRAIARALSDRGYTACLAWSPRGIWLCLRGGVCLFDGLTRDVNHWLTRGSKRVLLRHGVGIKRIERCIENPHHRLYRLFHGNPLQRAIWSVLIPWHRVRPDLALATSPQHVRQGSDCYGIPDEQFAITGFPRNDQIFAPSPNDVGDKDLHWLAECAAQGQPVVLYLPTFRDDQQHFRHGWQELDEIGARLGVRFLVKLHFVDAERGLGTDAKGFSNLYLADAYQDANRLYQRATAMIGDYSSAAYDFMLTGKPLVFFIPDDEQFRSFSRSLYYDYESVTPGPKARDFAELETALADVLHGDDPRWRQHYSAVLDLFHTYRDEGASQRAYRVIRQRFLPDARESLAGLPAESAD